VFVTIVVCASMEDRPICGSQPTQDSARWRTKHGYNFLSGFSNHDPLVSAVQVPTYFRLAVISYENFYFVLSVLKYFMALMYIGTAYCKVNKGCQIKGRN